MTTLQDDPQAEPDSEPAGTPGSPFRQPTYVAGRVQRLLSSGTSTLRDVRNRMPKSTWSLPKAAPPTTTSTTATWSLLLLAALVAWMLFYTLLVSSLQHGHDQGLLYNKLREQLALETAPIGGVINPGQPVAVLDIPAVGLRNEVIVEGTSASDLMAGPGHLRDTPLPGQPGTSVVLGRDKLFGGPFHNLAAAKSGDVITVTTGEGVAKYLVADVRHGGDTYAITSGTSRLTLITAQGGGWRAGWAPSKLVYVDAVLQGQPFGDPGGRPTSVPKTEAPLQPDVGGALYLLVLWLPALGIAVIGTGWIYQKWGRWQSWLVGVPVILAGLWGVSQSAVQLLPNLM